MNKFSYYCTGIYKIHSTVQCVALAGTVHVFGSTYQLVQPIYRPRQTFLQTVRTVYCNTKLGTITSRTFPHHFFQSSCRILEEKKKKIFSQPGSSYSELKRRKIHIAQPGNHTVPIIMVPATHMYRMSMQRQDMTMTMVSITLTMYVRMCV